MLLLAFKAFLLTHPGYKLIIFGEGPYRSQLEKIVLDLGLNESVELPGAVKDVWNKIVDAECFVLSSWFEGMPNGNAKPYYNILLDDRAGLETSYRLLEDLLNYKKKTSKI